MNYKHRTAAGARPSPTDLCMTSSPALRDGFKLFQAEANISAEMLLINGHPMIN